MTLDDLPHDTIYTHSVSACSLQLHNIPRVKHLHLQNAISFWLHHFLKREIQAVVCIVLNVISCGTFEKLRILTGI